MSSSLLVGFVVAESSGATILGGHSRGRERRRDGGDGA